MVVSADNSPILKVGAVLLRRCHAVGGVAANQRINGSADYEILIIQPIPKNSGELPQFVLPRGSRQYSLMAVDGSVVWHDARDAATGIEHAARLEPFSRALAREIEEEAGVSAAMLARAAQSELGALEFQSRTKGIYPIYWFVVTLQDADAARLMQQMPVDALAVRWTRFDEIRAMAAEGEFSAGYIPVIEAALPRAGSAA